MSTPAPGGDEAQTTQQLRNTIIIGVSVAAGLALLIAVIALCYRCYVRRDDQRRKEEREAAQNRRRDRYELPPGRVEHTEPEEAYCDAEFPDVRRPRSSRTRRGESIQEELRDVNSAVLRMYDAASGGSQYAPQKPRGYGVPQTLESDPSTYPRPPSCSASSSSSPPLGRTDGNKRKSTEIAPVVVELPPTATVTGTAGASESETVGPTVCCICLSERAKFAAVPCGHLALCGQCKGTVEARHNRGSAVDKKCPMCRQSYTMIIEVFL